MSTQELSDRQHEQPSNLERGVGVSIVVAKADEVALGAMKMVRVGARRLVLVHTSTGFHALDNACPHEGYGLVTGSLDGELLTCEWHNWKFRVSDGECVMGEEAVANHQVTVVDGDVVVTVVEPTEAQVREAAAASLDRGIDQHYEGQIARDSLRLLHAGVEPVELIWQGVARTIPRTEYGWTHALAMATDCITASSELTGDDRLLPIAQALSGLAESELRRPERPRPTPRLVVLTETVAGNADLDPSFIEFRRLVETEQADAADALLTGALQAGLSRAEAARWLIQSSCDHHLAFGHGAIYTQKAFEMLDAVGWDHAHEVLAHVSLMHITSTREDRLPYMRPFIRALDAAELGVRSLQPTTSAWDGREQLVEVLLGKDPVAALHAATAALDDGAGTTGLLDAVSVAAATRMLCHDLSHERRPQVTGYGWLDLTHSLTYCNAARWAWRMAPGPATARLAMYTVFHVVDSGRHASVLGADCATFLDGLAKDARTTTASLADALEQGQENAAVLAALTEPADLVAESLVRASLDDRAGALIVVAHHVKTARAAICEFAATGSRWPLAAAARFISAPAKQRFVTQDVSRARHFLTTGTPPPR